MYKCKQIPGLSQQTYEECLRKLELPTYRRSQGDMIELYKENQP